MIFFTFKVKIRMFLVHFYKFSKKRSHRQKCE